jgi:hypothetical protein
MSQIGHLRTLGAWERLPDSGHSLVRSGRSAGLSVLLNREAQPKRHKGCTQRLLQQSGN